MKTTNKILLAALIVIMAIFFFLMVWVRLNLNIGPATEGSLNVVTEKREVTAFNAIDASGGINVELVQGPEIGLTIEADDNLIEFIEIEVTDSVLKIRLREKIGDHKAIEVKVDFVSIEAIRASAGAKVSSESPIVGKALKFETSSGAISRLNLEFESIAIEASSGAQAELSGTAGQLMLQSSTGAIIEALGLKAENASVKSSSGAINNVSASNELSMEASSGAIVNYQGQPVIKNQKTSSGGIITGL